jgi:hypothetical protein
MTMCSPFVAFMIAAPFSAGADCFKATPACQTFPLNASQRRMIRYHDRT